MTEEKGITLIALIITIIILLILAMVSVSMVINSGLIGHTENAAFGYKEQEIKEMQSMYNLSGGLNELTYYGNGQEALDIYTNYYANQYGMEKF